MKLDTSSYYPKSPLDDSEYMPADQRPAVTDAGLPTNDMPEESTADEETAPAEVKESRQEAWEPDLPPTEAETFVTAVAHVLSWIFVPLLMPVYAALLAFDYTLLSFTGAGTRFMFTLIVAIINVAIPGLLVYVLKKIGVVQDVGLNNQKERFIPYVICIVCLLGTALFLEFKNAPRWLVMFYMGGAAAGIVEVIVNRWWKISVHAAGIAGIVALLTHLLIYEYTLPGVQTWLLISVGVAGLLGSSRVWLGRHTIWQVLAGYMVGFAGVYLMMLIGAGSGNL